MKRDELRLLFLVIMSGMFVSAIACMVALAWLNGIYEFPMTPAYFETVNFLSTLRTICAVVAIISMFGACAVKES